MTVLYAPLFPSQPVPAGRKRGADRHADLDKLNNQIAECFL